MYRKMLQSLSVLALLAVAAVAFADVPQLVKYQAKQDKANYVRFDGNTGYENRASLPAVGSRNAFSLDEVIISENFDAITDNTLPAGWTQVDEDGGTCAQFAGQASTWRARTYTGNAHSGTKVLFNHYNDGALPNDDWVILPQQTLGGTVTFSYWAASQDASYLESYEVRVSTTGNQPANFTNLIQSFTDIPTTWTQHTHDLSAYAGQPIYIAIHYTSVDEFVLKIDDLLLEAGQAAASGDISGTVRNLNTNAAISGVTVEVLGLGVSATTDAQGRYFLNNLPPATYDLNFSHGAYASDNAEDIVVAENDTAIVDMLLEPLPLEFHDYLSTGAPVQIPDLDSAEKTLTIPDDYLINDIDVTVNITHTWVGDLTVDIEAPNGDRVLLSDQNGGNGDGYVNTRFDDEATTAITAGTAPFTGTFSPEGELSNLDAFSCQGVWTLHASDNAGADVGQITNFTVHVTTEAAAADEHGNPLPTSIKFNGNYPNPFNPTTSFSFNMDRTAKVELKLYNTIGQVVATLIDGEVSAGEHHVYFNGAGLSSGIYFANFVAPGYTSSAKVVLMK